MELTRDGMARHVAEQSLVWQRQVAQDRIALLTKEAALHHGDDTLIDTLGDAAATAARAHARVGIGHPAGVLGAAIQARLDRGDTDGAKALFTQMQDQLDPAHAVPLQGRIETTQRLDSAKAYAEQVMPPEPSGSVAEVEGQRDAVLQRVALDHAEDPLQRMLAEHHVNVGFDARRTVLDEIDADRAGAIEHYVTTPNADGTQIAPPPDEIWNGLNDDEKARMLARLLRNGRNPDIAPVKDGTGSPDVGAQEGGAARRGVAPVVEPLPGSPEYEAAKALVPEALKAADIRSGVFPVVEPSPGTPEHATALAQVKDAQLAAADTLPGEIVVLPNGEKVPDGELLDDRNKRNKSPTGYMMSPVVDLSQVAEEGRMVGQTYRLMLRTNPIGAFSFLAGSLFRAVGTGGQFDYQRRGPQTQGIVKEVMREKDTFFQRPQYRNVSNFNVGLFAQQAGLTLAETLTTAGNGQSSSAIPTAARPMVSTGRRPSSLRKATKAVRAAFSALPIFREATISSNTGSGASYF